MDYAVEHPFRVKLIRARFWFKVWLAQVILDSRSPLFDPSARLQVMIALVVALLLLPHQDKNFVALLTTDIPSLPTVLVAVTGFIAINILVATATTSSIIKGMGVWYRHQFIFHEPRVVFTTVVTTEDNGRLIPFKLKEAEIGGSVELTVRTTGFGKNEARVRFSDDFMKQLPWDQYEHHLCLTWVYEDRTFHIETLKKQPSNATTVQVLLNSWWGRTHDSTLKGRPKGP